MASIVYNSFVNDIAIGTVDVDNDTFFVMLVNGYVENKAHTRLSDIRASEVSGTGYTANGVATTLSVTQDDVNNRLDIDFTNVSWSNSTVSADGCVIYKNQGATDADKPLVCFVDFGQVISSTNAAFAVTFSAPLRFQN